MIYGASVILLWKLNFSCRIKMIGKKTIVSITVVVTAVFWRNVINPNGLAPVVEVNTGKLQGIVSLSRDGREFYEYLNVPYAKPPIKDLRFEIPHPPDSWEGIRDASRYGPKCIQLDLFSHSVEGDENCLALNVHTPKINQTGSERSLLPVMVWFHGGLFIFGSAILYRPGYFMDNEDIILVTVNYRLGSFGFLNTGDGVIRGNMGLKDQNMALKWVQRNIKMFGGDPNLVTIFGESAGSASVHYHMLSVQSKGLFQKAISQSGLATNPWAIHKTPREQARRFGEILNCSMPDTKLMISCMKNLTAFEVVSGHQETEDPLHELSAVFVPTLEINIPDGNTFLHENPNTLLENGQFYKVPMLAGVNSEEGLINAAVILRNTTISNMIEFNWEEFIPRLLYLQDDIEPTVLQNLKDFYFNGKLDLLSQGDWKKFANLFSDRFWNVGFHNAIQTHVKHSSKPIHLYYYTYQSTFTLTDMVVALKGESHAILELGGMKISNWIKENILGEKIPRHGVCHGDELGMQFYIPLMTSVPKGSTDYGFSQEIVKLWTSFAKSHGDKSDLEFLGQKWPRQEPNEPLRYMQLDINPGMIAEPFKDRIDFWNSLKLE